MNSKYQLSSPSLLPTNTKLWSTYRQIGWKEGSILCDYSINGCTTRVDSYEDKLKHQQECEYEPNYSTACENCESKLKKSELKYHNCVRELISKIKGLQKSMQNLEEKVSQQTRDLDYVKQKLIELQSMQNKSNSDNMKSYTKQLIDKEVYFADDSVDHNEKYNSNAIEAQFDETKAVGRDSIRKNRVRVLPTIYTKNANLSRGHTEEEVDFGMYGSQKYKYLSQLSRELSCPTTESKSLIGLDYTKKNKEKLINVTKQSSYNEKLPIVRLRSWSARKDKY